MCDGFSSRDLTQLIWIRFLFGRIVCSNNVIWIKNCPRFHYFGTFAGAGTRHEGLRWLKPCQFQKTVSSWHCECDKLQMPDWSYWQFVVQGQGAIKATEPCLTRLQLADMEVSINCRSDRKTFSVLLKPGHRLIKTIKLVWGRFFPLKEHSVKFPGMQCGQIPACWLLGWGCWQKGAI